LCEKPVTSNAAELRSLLSLANEHGVFFMEGMWTKFHPLSRELQKYASSGELGNPVIVHADLSGDFDIESKYAPRTHLLIADLHRYLDWTQDPGP
jgi:predicted dehydrogenase